MGLLHDTCKCGWPLKLLYDRGKNHPVSSYFGLVTTPGFYPSPNMYIYIYMYIYVCVCMVYIPRTSGACIILAPKGKRASGI